MKYVKNNLKFKFASIFWEVSKMKRYSWLDNFSHRLFLIVIITCSYFPLKRHHLTQYTTSVIFSPYCHPCSVTFGMIQHDFKILIFPVAKKKTATVLIYLNQHLYREWWHWICRSWVRVRKKHHWFPTNHFSLKKKKQKHTTHLGDGWVSMLINREKELFKNFIDDKRKMHLFYPASLQ